MMVAGRSRGLLKGGRFQVLSASVLYSDIDRSNCVILCLSENYFSDQHCYKEANHAYEQRKNIIPVKVEYCQSTCWIRKFIEKLFCFSFFGSDKHLNSEYDKLFLKIVSISVQT